MNNIENIAFTMIDWSSIPKIKYDGETGTAVWQTMQFNGLRIRIVEYSVSYLADHWCEKGHIVQCLDGTMTTQLSDGTDFVLKKGDTFVVSDGLSSHRTLSTCGSTLMIIDGDFLRNNGK